jgi:hypothetical protein
VALQEEMGIETRKINPPKLGPGHMGKKVLCHRALRVGGPKIEVEDLFGKVIASNYGHSGSGWTLAPGSVNHLLDLLEKKLTTQKIGKDEPIAIVGAGVMGLMSAIELKRRGFNKIRILAEEFDELTSHKAGGQFAPVYMSNSPEKQALMDRIGVFSYNFYKEIVLERHPYLKRGVSLMPDYFENKEDFCLEAYVAAGVMQPAKEVILDFQNGTTRKMFAYDDCIMMDVPQLMHDLHQVVLSKNIPILKQSIQAFSEVKERVVLNCAGFGAKKLMNDEELISVQGHLLMLKNQNPEDLSYMIDIYLEKTKTSTGLNNRRAFYLFPKRLPGSLLNDVGVLGGTYVEHADASMPHEEEFDILIENAKRFYGL